MGNRATGLVVAAISVLGLASDAVAFQPPPMGAVEGRAAPDSPDLLTSYATARADGAAGGRRHLHPGTARLHALVLLVDFADSNWTTDLHPPAYFDSLLFGVTTPSVRRYFDEVSRGRLALTGDVLPVERFDTTIADYTGQGRAAGIHTYPTNAQRLAEDLVLRVDPGVDFTRHDGDGDGTVDVLIVVTAGVAFEDGFGIKQFASHQWHTVTEPILDGVRVSSYVLLSEWSGLGGFAHEMVHLWGIPDLYDVDDLRSQGLGVWSLMASGARLNRPGEPPYSNPAHLDPWTRMRLGFLEPITDPFPGRGMDGTLSLSPVETVGGVLRAWTGKRTGSEYFLVENRSVTAGEFDRALPGDGLLIYHVDEAEPLNANPFHYKVALEQADGRFDLESGAFGIGPQGDDGDPFPGSTDATRFDVSTIPDSRAYSTRSSGVAITSITRDTGDGTISFDLALAEGPGLVAEDVALTESTGDGDLRPEAGETWSLSFAVRNAGRDAGPTTLNLSTSPGITPLPASLPITPLAAEERVELTRPIELTFAQDLDADPFTIPLTFTFVGSGATDVTSIRLAGGTSFGLTQSFEADEGGWTHGLVGSGIADPWHRTPLMAADGTWSMSCGDVAGGDYPDSIDAALESPPVLLGAGSSLRLSHAIDAESRPPRDALDGGRAEISTDGVHWTPLDPLDGYTHVPIRNGTSWLFDHDLWGGFSGGFGEDVFDLMPWDGRAVWIRLRFASDFTNGAETYAGWFVDDVHVETDDAPIAFQLGDPRSTEDAVRVRWSVVANRTPFTGTVRVDRVDGDTDAMSRSSDPTVLEERDVVDLGLGEVVDTALAPGDQRTYRLLEITDDGALVRAERQISRPAPPTAATVLGAAPNPFPAAGDPFRIRIAPTSATGITGSFYDGGGRRVAIREAAEEPDGGRLVSWDGRTDRGVLSSAGVYFYRVADATGREIGRGRVVLVR